ncbi:PREDICTED: mitochondrial outer membrane protein porin 2-like [Prunus mume]|uniref:Mitochondrial outer membrane protein porin 2-like n=1 Tax=Prunus mume TaxID=102107 RepID=A0ABM0N6P4_PRUMU|nr:PREDICTED: mitochondrial outer membrane protein porin 2-like [Prunus mume]
MSTKGPALFSNIGKKATDLLNKDYSTDQKINITTNTETGVTLNSGLVKKGGLSCGDVAAQYKYKNAALNVKADTESNISTMLTITDILPSTKTIASIKLPDYKSGKLEVQYLHEHASFTTAVGLNGSPAVDVSATLGTPSIAFGAEASYLTSSRVFAKYNAGVSLTKQNSSASVILADKGDSLRGSYLHHLSKLNGGAVVGEVNRRFSTNENTLTVGCSYVVDPETVVKARLNNHGNLGALLQHQLTPKSSLTISGAFDTKALEKNPKFGLALSLKP